MDEIDCGSSSFAFAADGFHVNCERSTDQVRAEGSTGASEIDLMTVSGDDRHVFMTIVGIRVTAPRLYMERRSLGENFRDAFDDIRPENWKGIGNKDGYDTAEFTHQRRALFVHRHPALFEPRLDRFQTSAGRDGLFVQGA